MRKFANIARRVFGNSVQASYFERIHWSILIFWTLQTAEHFEYLGSFSVNNFEAFCECDEVY
jgi:hypothetical protein